MSLTDALIPLYETEGYGSPGPGYNFFSDDFFLCMAINYLFETQPEKFGSYATREKLKEEIADYISAHRTVRKREFVPILPQLEPFFARHGVNPFSETRLAYLGGNDSLTFTVFGEHSQKLRAMFADFLDLQPKRTVGLWAGNAQDFIGAGKYDIVVSGNVLNEPRIRDVRSIFAGAANILKQGGVAIHGMNYSNDHYYDVMNARLHEYCGQEVVTLVRKKGPDAHLVEALVTRQAFDAVRSEEDVRRFCRPFCKAAADPGVTGTAANGKTAPCPTISSTDCSPF